FNLAHYALLIDVAGESSSGTPRGLMLHMTADERKEVIPLHGHLSSHMDKMIDHFLLGKIKNIYHHSPNKWAFELGKAVNENWFSEFVRGNGPIWSYRSNCQQFSRFLVSKLEFIWPHVKVAGDGNYLEPIIVDFNIIFSTSS
ncbi:hypothetical protein SAMD00019534_048400, partial [Acytostelium subglobosum LB1]|uniref:hypothetical protein n=1 Tax=Acytostelium subglobosum LB1 TaxID=1410327 RepID=UPI0006448545